MREDILEKRYFWKDDSGAVIEDWSALCRRVVNAVTQDEQEREEFLGVMESCLFLPNTPALTNAGRPNFTMSACFVLPVADSIDEIFDAVKFTALIHKMGGGTGFSFSRLRPGSDPVGSTKGVASGPCSFLRVFNEATEIMKQGGTRRGANMGILRVDHPDIMTFIGLKEDPKKFQNFNFSVGITREFWDAMLEDREYDLVFDGQVRGKLRAKFVWESIVKHAWTNGDPGIVFLDTINAANPTPHVGEIEATNPCGELPLLPYEACVLGSVNLSKMVNGEKSEVDWGRLGKTVLTGVKFLDNIVDVQAYPLPQIEEMHKANRKIGLGVMGWADMLIKMKIDYDCPEAWQLAEKIMQFVTQTAEDQSATLAEEKGCFPNWEGSVWEARGRKMRNATCTTIAPTGTLSIIAECSSGIEPVFGWETKQIRADQEFFVTHPLYREWQEQNAGGRRLPSYFVASKDVSVEAHLVTQAAFQKYCHNAVSKTINMPKKATAKDVENAYLLARDLGLKGITIYRDESREGQIISSGDGKGTGLMLLSGDDLPDVLPAKRIRVKTGEGYVYVLVSEYMGLPAEVFAKTPWDTIHEEIYEGYTRFLSTGLRGGIPLEKWLTQMERVHHKSGMPGSPPSVLLKALKIGGYTTPAKNNGNLCPDCKGTMVFEEGCMKCIICGYSKC